MSGRYGGNIKGRRQQRPPQPWRPPLIPQAKPRPDVRGALLMTALGLYGIILGMLPVIVGAI